jgi:hypothetical protein
VLGRPSDGRRDTSQIHSVRHANRMESRRVESSLVPYVEHICHVTRVDSGAVKLRKDLSLQRVNHTQFHSAGMQTTLTIKIPFCLTDVEFSSRFSFIVSVIARFLGK